MISLRNWQENTTELNNMGVQTPKYDVALAKKNGTNRPKWIHIGGGNLYRTFHAEIADDLLSKGLIDSGVVVVNTRSPFAIDKIYKPFNNDILMVKMCTDGQLKKRILASTANAIFASKERAEQWEELVQYFRDPKLQFVTYTITEKGYSTHDSAGNLTEATKKDIANSPEDSKTAMGITTYLLYERFKAGAAPIAMVTTDNFSQNGQKFKDAVTTIAKEWQEKGSVESEFVEYVTDKNKVGFPISMIDRITPNPSDEVAKILQDEGFSDLEIKHTPGGTGFSSFANTEETSYLVIEDNFPNNRPPLEDVGVILCDRKTAILSDTMKVTGCLNPLHTGMAIFGCMLGYTRIWQEMQDQDIVNLIKKLAYDEDLPVLVNPKVLSPQKFVKDLLEIRLPNKSLPDAPQRIACDTSQKIPIRFGVTLNTYANNPNLKAEKLTIIPLIIAGWLRYLTAKDDEGKAIELSSDPMLEELQGHMANIKLGTTDKNDIHAAVKPILSNEKIFNCNLYEIGLGEKIESLLAEMLEGPGAIRNTLRKYVN